jgi:ligand-binding sensor domain-containing protein
MRLLKNLAIGLFLTLGVVHSSFAQNQNNTQQSVSITVSAMVNGVIEMITIQTMDFQNIDRDDSVVRINPIQSNRAGKMVARGAPNAEFRVDYMRQRELSNLDGEGMIFFTYEVAGNAIDDQETAELMDQDIRDLQFNDDGEFYIWVGGNVDLSNVEPGSYQGEFTIEIEYI